MEYMMWNARHIKNYDDILKQAMGAVIKPTTTIDKNCIDFNINVGIKDVNIIVPNKVVEVTFTDGKKREICM